VELKSGLNMKSLQHKKDLDLHLSPSTQAGIIELPPVSKRNYTSVAAFYVLKCSISESDTNGMVRLLLEARH
jgi:hypothetical protein